MNKYLIIGNGVAGTTAAENIRSRDSKGIITIITDEDLPFYSRIRLIEYLAKDITEQALVIKKEQWYQKHNINLMLNTKIIDADLKNKLIITKDKQKFFYDKLLIAAGSQPFIPPLKGIEKSGVFVLRNIKDARKILNYVDNINNILVIGSGLLGIEAGNSLRKLGKNVIIIESSSGLLSRQLDKNGMQKLRTIMEEMGFSFISGNRAQELTGKDKVDGVLFKSGDKVPAEMVIISTGVRPDIELANVLKLNYNKGINVNEYLHTNQPDIFASGDVAEFKGITYGIWPAAMEQGRIAGANMAGEEITYKGSLMSNILKAAGIDLASAGNIDAENQFESRIVMDEKVYKKIVIDNDKIIGCIMLGDKKGFNKITKAISEKKKVFQIKDQILTKEFDFNKFY
ncbi:FAD-dependent oxidoreductase [Candidatus Magnetomoraceae bacterium gMMP-15]